jgi:hypothetical protein
VVVALDDYDPCGTRAVDDLYGATEVSESPEEAAQRTLQSVWHVGRSLKDVRLPVDPVRIARDLGLDVRIAPMQADVSGALENRPGRDPVIYLSIGDARNRQRFTCAHEIGHYVKRTNEGNSNYEFVDRRAVLASTGLDPDERFANQFAAELLMPADAVRRLRKQGFGPADLAARFGVSGEAMNLRLKNLGVR